MSSHLLDSWFAWSSPLMLTEGVEQRLGLVAALNRRDASVVSELSIASMVEAETMVVVPQGVEATGGAGDAGGVAVVVSFAGSGNCSTLDAGVVEL